MRLSSKKSHGKWKKKMGHRFRDVSPQDRLSLFCFLLTWAGAIKRCLCCVLHACAVRLSAVCPRNVFLSCLRPSLGTPCASSPVYPAFLAWRLLLLAPAAPASSQGWGTPLCISGCLGPALSCCLSSPHLRGRNPPKVLSPPWTLLPLHGPLRVSEKQGTGGPTASRPCTSCLHK